MKIQRFTPTIILQPYIHQYYLAEGDFGASTRDVFFADGCIEMVFNIGLDFYKDDQKENWAKLIGQITQPLNVRATGKGKSFGIWFTPHGFSRFSNIPANEFTNKTIPLELVFDQNFIDSVGDYLTNNNIHGLLHALNRYFEKSAMTSSTGLKDQIAVYSSDRLLSNGEETDLNLLANTCNVSPRYLQKIFKDRIGIAPKQLQRISRFQKALHQITESPKVPFTAVTYDAGYYDQSHFIREFRAFTGFKPSDYQLRNHPINQYFLKA